MIVLDFAAGLVALLAYAAVAVWVFNRRWAQRRLTCHACQRLMPAPSVNGLCGAHDLKTLTESAFWPLTVPARLVFTPVARRGRAQWEQAQEVKRRTARLEQLEAELGITHPEETP